jgi:ABC-type branched-subunit amino acid transport system ATPase component
MRWQLIILQNTNTVIQSSSIKVLVYGQAGAGKTSLIPTMPKPVILSAEGGLLSIAGSDIPFIEVTDMAALREAYAWLAGSDEARAFESVALDSISEIAEVCLGNEKKAKAKTHALRTARCRRRWRRPFGHSAICRSMS